MDLLTNLATGFATSLAPTNILYAFIGALLGTLIGVLPGLGPLATIALLLPLTIGLPPETSLIMLAGIYYGAQYGGSTTAILMNLPGESSSAVTALDGYKMARQGRAGTALATAAIGSFFAGSVSTLLIALIGAPLAALALRFGAPEYFSLMLLGLLLAVSLSHGSVLKGMAMATLGILLGLIRLDPYTGMERFTMGFISLQDGLDIAPIAIGIFGVAEVLRNLRAQHGSLGIISPALSKSRLPREELKRAAAASVRGTAIGSVLGILPGGGAMLASFASYTLEKKIAADPSRFGNGAIEGVAGPESANNAGSQMSFVPMLTLGLPSNPIMALMIGAMIMQGITPGPNVATTRPDLYWGLITSMWVGNLMLLILNLPLVGLWVKLLAVPYRVIVPCIMVFSILGIYSIDHNAVSVVIIALFGLGGYLLSKLNCEPAPLLLGFVLGSMMEEHFRRAMLVSGGKLSIFVSHPISAGLLVVAAGVILAVALPALRKRRTEVFVESEQ